MSEDIQENWFSEIEEIVSDPLRFKAKLAIGEEAYASIRMKNAVFGLWDVAGAASTGVAVAQSATVASTFFAPSGVLALLGFGTAVTPIGWVIAAGVVAGGGWIGITQYLKNTGGSRVTAIPEFINTPMDVLALGLFDLMAPLALKVASIDGDVDTSEKEAICNYFEKQWGLNPDFVEAGIKFTQSNLSDYSIKEVALSLADFEKKSKDCNFKVMSRELIEFLREVIEVDGRIDEREEMAIEKVQTIFGEVDRFNLKDITKKGVGTVTAVTKSGVDTVTGIARKISQVKLPHKSD